MQLIGAITRVMRVAQVDAEWPNKIIPLLHEVFDSIGVNERLQACSGVLSELRTTIELGLAASGNFELMRFQRHNELIVFENQINNVAQISIGNLKVMLGCNTLIAERFNKMLVQVIDQLKKFIEEYIKPSLAIQDLYGDGLDNTVRVCAL